MIILRYSFRKQFISLFQDISVSRAMSEKLNMFEEAQNVVIDYGHSGGHQRSRPMTGYVGPGMWEPGM